MSSNELIFKLIRETQCPLYERGDIFILAGNALRLKFEKESTFISTAIVRVPNHKELPAPDRRHYQYSDTLRKFEKNSVHGDGLRRV
jgi:hypothetical protein